MAGLVLVTGCSAGSGTSAGGTKTTSAAGDAAVAGSAGAAASTAPGTTPGSTPGDSPGTTSPSGPPAATIASSVPVRLQIPDIGLDTPIVPLGLAADGTVQVPPIEANSPAGWYQGSPTPGRTGPSVILGHVTVGRYGDGVFRRLAGLHQGSRIVVRLQDGVSAAFTVDSVKTVAKDQFPTQEVYGNVDRPELRLITCGGPRTDAGYSDNVLVFASLAGTA